MKEFSLTLGFGLKESNYDSHKYQVIICLALKCEYEGINTSMTKMQLAVLEKQGDIIKWNNSSFRRIVWLTLRDGFARGFGEWKWMTKWGKILNGLRVTTFKISHSGSSVSKTSGIEIPFLLIRELTKRFPDAADPSLKMKACCWSDSASQFAPVSL